MYPLTNFQQLAGLCNNEPFCKKTFSKYRLIAIILQKEQDSVLGHNLSNAFDRLQTRISSVEFLQHFIFRTHPEREFIAHIKGVKKDRKKIENFLKNSLSYCESIL